MRTSTHQTVLIEFLQILWTANAIGSALVLWRLFSLQIARTYRFFLASIAIKVLRSAILLFLNPHTQAYYYTWTITQPILWISYVLVVYELYSLVLKNYPGIQSLSRKFFFTAVATASIVAALTVMPTMVSGLANKRQPLLYPYALIERANNTSLAVFLLLLLAFVMWFSVPLSHNLLAHCSIYSAYFFLNNVVFLYWHTVGRSSVMWVNLFTLSSWIICVLCWVFLLSRTGESRTTSLRLGRSPIEERRLLGQLEALNATLLRTARK